MTELEKRWTLMPKTAGMSDSISLDALKDATGSFQRALKDAKSGRPFCQSVAEAFEQLEEFLESGGSELVGAAQYASAAARKIYQRCR